MTTLLDDHLLGRALTDTLTEDDLDAIDGDVLATTGCWYYRLCHAARSTQVQGSLSSPIAALSTEHRFRVLDLLTSLPAEITVAPLRELAPKMAELVERHPLNLLSLEALAAAMEPRTVLVVERRNLGPALQRALASEGVEVRLVG